MNFYSLLTASSSVSIATSIFTIIYILKIRKEKNIKGTLICLIIFCIMLRIGISILIYFLSPNISSIAFALGFLGHSLLGPLLIFYLIDSKTKPITFKQIVAHSTLPLTGFLYILFFNKNIFNLYLLCSISLGLYLTYIYISNTRTKHFNKNKVDNTILKLVSFLFVIFLIQSYTPSLNTYAITIALTSIAMYVLFYILLKNPKKLTKEINKITIKPEHKEKVIKQLTVNKYYVRNNINLTKFSNELLIPKYIITKIINTEYEMSFPEVINKLRVEEILEKLKNPKSMDLKV